MDFKEVMGSMFGRNKPQQNQKFKLQPVDADGDGSIFGK